MTSNGGSFAIGGLSPGEASLELSGERFQASDPIPVELVDGVRELVVTLDWKPGTLQVVTRGRGEVPVDALVRFEGPESLEPMPVGPDGEEFFELAPGAWTVGVSASSFGLQVREVQVEADETSLIVISAVLREEEGDAVLALAVNDPKGNPIEGARIALDGEPIGATSTGGTLRLEGLAPGEMTLEVAGNLFEYKAISPLSLDEGENDLDLVLQWLAGTVNVRTVDSTGTPVDALVRAYGPAVLPPVRVGPDGERVLYLEPGGWAVVASSESYGIEEEDVDVKPGQEALVSVSFELEVLAAEESAFVLAVQDVDGNPVSGALVKLGDSEHTTPDGGTVVLEDASAGSLDVAVTATGYAPVADTLDVVGGNQTRTLTLDFIPQPVQITVQTDQGKPLEAEVRFVGPATVPSMKTGADGVATTELRPGEWTVVAQAPELGAGRAEFAFEPGTAPEAMVVELKDTNVEVEGDTVVILQKVQFDTGRATIKEASFPLLDEVANVLLINPQIVRVEIQGHTDNVGTDETNKKLSQRRAQAVRDYLIDAGVKKSRLVAEGKGSTEPVESNDTEAGRSANRRVQFEIVEVDESKRK
ncbi:MAG: OmpA family protein [Proteobacteria bacterium]|nr:OmpA family protein [Pseudomonadota bacterium]MCP4915330.1 OmpA family protein [Pseudomonadota bacterium]